MAVQISINTEVASAIHAKAMQQIDQAEALLKDLVENIEKLYTEGEWKGDAADKFLSEHEQLKPVLVQKTPETLRLEAENLKKNLENLIQADAVGSGR